MAKAELEAFMIEREIAISSTFVPWSQSRNKDEKDNRGNPIRSLNWRVTIARKGREILTTDYGADIAHCPAFKIDMKPFDGRRENAEAIALECEAGKKARRNSWSLTASGGPILPDPCDVLSSLALDASVLDHATYENWAGELGYDPDSRKGEAIYRACLDIALRLRAGLGENGLDALRNASQDY